jgi:hypothetical protein
MEQEENTDPHEEPVPETTHAQNREPYTAAIRED